jgi:formylglycine-generating enzyme required for sulfatase activity
VEITCGYFQMGTNEDVARASLLESIFAQAVPPNRHDSHGPRGPRRWVEVPTAFWVSVREIRLGEYSRVRRLPQPTLQDAQLPVRNLSWAEAVEFCKILTRAHPGLVFALPSEAQWEYVARCGTSTPYFFGSGSSSLPRYAWFSANSRGYPRPAGSLVPNHWGIFDLYGNVAEWCQDEWHEDFTDAPQTSVPWQTESGELRVVRGGAFDSGAAACSSDFRWWGRACDQYPEIGFRLVAYISKSAKARSSE